MPPPRPPRIVHTPRRHPQTLPACQRRAGDPAHIRALDAVVNNAGIAVTAPLEGLALADPRRQLETAFARSRCFV
jgi:hypothetical protein